MTTIRSAPSGFGWPLPGSRDPHGVVRTFDAPETAYGPGHRGVDLAGIAGRPVRAAAAGTVVHAGRLVDRNVISIEHPGGLRTTYEPVTPEVAAGQRVVRGQRIGTLDTGHPECAAPPSAACLHWGARLHLDYLDPLRLLGHRAVRLLPWRDVPSKPR
ncbi:M23 family metallopeptidase [Halopolyspora algeriensis]|uniref:M23 family metallopeptidase n=1 Tax=Halopolyspora algeriensis TaxID=1500506 RepID=UPI0030B850F9